MKTVTKNDTVGLNGRGKNRVSVRYHNRHGKVVNINGNRAVVQFFGDRTKELPVSYLKAV